MSDLFGNHIVGFPTRQLKCASCTQFLKKDILVLPQILQFFIMKDAVTLENESHYYTREAILYQRTNGPVNAHLRSATYANKHV